MTENKRSAREEAVRFLTARARTTYEVQKRLREKGFGPEEIRQVIGEFAGLGYLDDGSYARSYCEYAYAKLRGQNRILRELAERGIERETAMNACEDVRYEQGIDEQANAVLAAERVLVDLSRPPEQKDLARAARRLEALGYDNSTILSVIARFRDEGE